MDYQEQTQIIRNLTEKGKDSSDVVAEAMGILKSQNEDYHWVGVYLLKGKVLHLGPFHGPATDHKEIAVGTGVCGTAVAEDQNQRIDDVSTLDNYLACNLHTKAELVVLVRNPGDEVIGQIDIDGRRVGMFGVAEEKFIHGIGEILAPAMTKLQSAL